MRKVIKSLAQLKLRAEDKYFECYITLADGSLVSSKVIMWDGKRFHIENLIDGSHQSLTSKQIMDDNITNIGYAVTHNALCYED